MKKFFRIVVALVLMGGWALAASALYVVRSPSGFVIIPKDCLGYRDTYVDTSGWDLNQAAAHPVVSQRLIETGHADRLSHVTKATSVEDLKAQIRAAVSEKPAAPTTKPAVVPAETAQAE
jgi:hypothetical protein